MQGPLQPLAAALLQLAQAHATYGELAALRSARTAMASLIHDQASVRTDCVQAANVCATAMCTQEPTMLQAGGALAALLFFPGSRPLYAQLLSLIHSMPDAAAVYRLMLTWIDTLALAAKTQGTAPLPDSVPAYLAVSLPKGPRCPLASVAGVLLSMPVLKDAAARASMRLLHPLTTWLRSTVNTTVNAAAVNAEHQEQCQDVVKVLLVLLQVARREGGKGVAQDDICALADVACSAMQTAALPREGLVMLGSLLWEAWALPQSSPAVGAALLGSVVLSERVVGRGAPAPVGWAAEHLAARGTSLAGVLATCDPLARVHALQGIVFAVSNDVLTHPAGADGRRTCLECLRAVTLAQLLRSSNGPLRSNAAAVLLASLQQQCAALGGTLQCDAVARGLLLGASEVDSLLGAMLSNWEDPSDVVSSRLRSCFETIMDILTIQATLPIAAGAPGSNDVAYAHTVLQALPERLLSSTAGSKAQLQALRCVVERRGAAAVLAARPALPAQLLQSTMQDRLGNSSANLLQQLLEKLHVECGAADDTDAAAYSTWTAAWLPPMIDVLAGNDCRLRSSVATHALHIPLTLDGRALGTLCSALLPECPTGDQVLGLVAVLRVARTRGLWTSFDKVPSATGKEVPLPHWVLDWAASRADPAMQLETLLLVVEHPRSSTPLDDVEQRLTSAIIQQNMHTTVPAFRNQLITVLTKAVSRVQRAARRRARSSSVKPDLHLLSAFCCSQLAEPAVESLGRAGASHYRRLMALDVLTTLVTCCGPAPGAPLSAWAPLTAPDDSIPSAAACNSNADTHKTSGNTLVPFPACLLTAETTATLFELVLDSWEVVRDSAATLLMALPQPLPGLTTPADVQHLAITATVLLSSPRLHDADAGASLLMLLFRVYVQRLGWSVRLFPTVCIADNGLEGAALQGGAIRQATVDFLDGLLAWLQANVAAANADLLAACRAGLGHGCLLVTRTVMMELQWAGAPASLHGALQAWVDACLDALLALAEVVLPVVATPQDHHLGAEDVLQEPSADPDDLGPPAQLITSGCWMATAQLSMAMGAMAHVLPLGATTQGVALSAAQVERLWAYMRRLALTTKHNGATERSQPGLLALACRCSRSTLTNISTAPAELMLAVLRHMHRQGQSQDDVIRRSAGGPFAVATLFQAETRRPQQPLVHSTMRCLFHWAWHDLSSPLSESLLTAAAGGRAPEPLPADLKGPPCAPWTQVHALNTLKQVFVDRELSSVTAGYVALGVEAAILCMGSSHWPVRNSASLLYSVLVTRITGFRNQPPGSPASLRSLSAQELFARYPSLLPCLVAQLRVGVQCLEASRITAHPALCPTLVLLSRLRVGSGGAAAAQAAAAADSSTLLEGVMAVATQAAALQLRVLAAAALAPLVARADALQTATALVHAFPATAAALRGHSNQAHGLLLMAHALVNAAYPPASPAEAQVALTPAQAQQLPALINAVQSRLLWVLPGRAPAAIKRDATLLLAALCALPGRGQQGLRDCALQTCQACLLGVNAVTSNAGGRVDQVNPMWDPWLKQTTALWCTLLLPEGLARDDVLAVVQRVLTSPVASVRGTLLKRLSASSKHLPRALTPLLLRCLGSETHPKVLQRLLLVLSAAPVGDAEAAGLWEGAGAVQQRTALPEALHGRLVCMARAHGLLRAAGQAPPLDALMTDMQHHAEPAATERSRMAAVDALKASGLLAELDPSAWRVAWALLQDEDDGVRAAAALLCSSVLSDSTTARGHPECGHKVQLRVVTELARRAQSRPLLLRCMLQWVCDPQTPPAPLPGATLSHKPSRLFEREKVNDFEEPLTAALYAAQALQSAVDTLSPACVEEVAAWQRALQAVDVPPSTAAPFDLLARVAEESHRMWRDQVALGLRVAVSLMNTRDSSQ